jgi:hypothetical protein
MDATLETEIIHRFVKKERRPRLLALLENPEKRARYLDAFRSPALFDPRVVTEIGGRERTPTALPDVYKKLGMGGRVYVVSDHHDWDGKKFQMKYIVGECLAQCIDTLGYDWKSKTAFYEWHHSGASWFLRGS